MLAAAQVIDAVAARLRGLPLAGTRVYTSRAWPIADAQLPAWRVTAEDESVQPLTISALKQHVLTIRLTGYARAVQELDDRLHELAEEALTALFRPQQLPPVGDALDDLAQLVDLQLTGLARDHSAEGESAHGEVTLTLQATFHVMPDAPGAFA